jgi:hypothetical protein
MGGAGQRSGGAAENILQSSQGYGLRASLGAVMTSLLNHYSFDGDAITPADMVAFTFVAQYEGGQLTADTGYIEEDALFNLPVRNSFSPTPSWTPTPTPTGTGTGTASTSASASETTAWAHDDYYEDPNAPPYARRRRGAAAPAAAPPAPPAPPAPAPPSAAWLLPPAAASPTQQQRRALAAPLHFSAARRRLAGSLNLSSSAIGALPAPACAPAALPPTAVAAALSANRTVTTLRVVPPPELATSSAEEAGALLAPFFSNSSVAAFAAAWSACTFGNASVAGAVVLAAPTGVLKRRSTFLQRLLPLISAAGVGAIVGVGVSCTLIALAAAALRRAQLARRKAKAMLAGQVMEWGTLPAAKAAACLRHRLPHTGTAAATACPPPPPFPPPRLSPFRSALASSTASPTPSESPGPSGSLAATCSASLAPILTGSSLRSPATRST